MFVAGFDNHRVGVVAGDSISDITEVIDAAGVGDPSSRMVRLIAKFEELKPEIQKAAARAKKKPVAQVRLRPPVPAPSKILCAWVNYHAHVGDMAGREEPTKPEIFLKSPACIIGPGDVVELPNVPVRAFHHEAELAVIIGKPTKKARLDNAMDAVFGYATFIDVSARGLPDQVIHFRGKSYDTFGPLGPAIATKDEVGDPSNLLIRLWVNNELRQEARTSDMIFKIPELIVYASAVTTLLPGDIIATGSPGRPGPIKPGDSMTIEIEKVGRMTVSVGGPV